MTSALDKHLPPDLEAFLHMSLTAAGFTGVRVWTVDVTTQWPQWVTTHMVQVDARASSKQKAYRKAWEVAQAFFSLKKWDEGVISNVGILNGPGWLPDENGAPRYVARYLFTVHPGMMAPTN